MAEESGTNSGVKGGSGVIQNSQSKGKTENTKGNSFKLTTIDFNGTDYREWSQSAKIILIGERKFGCLNYLEWQAFYLWRFPSDFSFIV